METVIESSILFGLNGNNGILSKSLNKRVHTVPFTVKQLFISARPPRSGVFHGRGKSHDLSSTRMYELCFPSYCPYYCGKIK